MTLEDDVESILSENNLNQSNSSMFKVRTGILSQGIDLGGGGQGDSTFRVNEDSVLGGIDNDKADIISESEDGGWYQSDKDGGFQFGQKEADDELSDISENSQDDDDYDVEIDEKGIPQKKKAKGDRKKKKRKKKEEKEAAEAQAA